MHDHRNFQEHVIPSHTAWQCLAAPSSEAADSPIPQGLDWWDNLKVDWFAMSTKIHGGCYTLRITLVFQRFSEEWSFNNGHLRFNQFCPETNASLRGLRAPKSPTSWTDRFPISREDLRVFARWFPELPPVEEICWLYMAVCIYIWIFKQHSLLCPVATQQSEISNIPILEKLCLVCDAEGTTLTYINLTYINIYWHTLTIINNH